MMKLDIFYPFLISALLGEDKFVCGQCFEIIGEYSAAACTHSGDFLEQVITTSINTIDSLFTNEFTFVKVAS